MGIDVECAHVFEFWSRSYKGVVRGRYETVIAPRCTEVLFLTDGDAPAVVGTDSSLIPITNYTLDTSRLETSFCKKNEGLYLAASDVSSDTCDVSKIADGLFKITSNGSSNVVLTVK